MALPNLDFWLISAPGDKTCQDTFDKLNRATCIDNKLSTNFKLVLPDLKVGTLDQLVGLSDDLGKLDTLAESVTRKLVQYFADVLEDHRDKLLENLLVGNRDIQSYLTKFQWESAKYPVKQPLRNLTEIISKQVSQIDTDLKTKATNFNNLKNNLASLERKATGSLLTKELSDVVRKEDFVLDSEYMTTLLVVVPRNMYKEWTQEYEKLADMVVPQSTKLISEDLENGLFTVTLFKKVVDEYKLHCRENKFIVRDFVYDEEALKAGKNERDKLSAEKHRQHAPLVRWLKTNFGEMFSAWTHVKGLRVFVESVLRYGLPVNFQAMLVQPQKKTQKRLKEVLNHLYAHLDSSAAGNGHIDLGEEMPGLMGLGQQEYYAYVFFKINVDMLEGIKI